MDPTAQEVVDALGSDTFAPGPIQMAALQTAWQACQLTAGPKWSFTAKIF